MSRKLIAWYRRCRRDLPWRVAPGAPPEVRPDPYQVLVSETMLQQTQVATVIPYFRRFIEAFPTIRTLAEADEQRVLRLWQGLGYYSRARNLLAAAREVVERFGGEVPQAVEDLRTLPGVGRYTAGAIASLAFDVRAPILDGNVTRVLCRIDGITSDPRQKTAADLLWQRAMQILPRKEVGDFNSALMELGATICTPRGPKCLVCPVRSHCEALATGRQEQIPPPRTARSTPLLRRRTWCIRRDTPSGEPLWLIEQRPSSGRWGAMWQFITRPVSAGSAPPVPAERPIRLGHVQHALTHRRYRFDVFLCDASVDQPAGSQVEAGMRWVRLEDLDRYPLPRPHVRIAHMVARQVRAGAEVPADKSRTI